MEARVSETTGRQLLEVRSLTGPTECRRRTEASIVDQDDQYVRRALRRTQLANRGIFRVRILRVECRKRDWCHVRNWQHVARDSVLPVRFDAAFRSLCRLSLRH